VEEQPVAGWGSATPPLELFDHVASPRRSASGQGHVHRGPRERLDHGIEGSLELVGKAFIHHTTGHDGRCPFVVQESLPGPNDLAPRGLGRDSLVDLLHDIAAGAELPELLLPA
jgi:hypothetical protein